MSAGLIVKKEDGETLYDTRLITYGLVKSGPVTSLGLAWRRNLPSGLPGGTYDYVYSFRVPNAIAPIVFVTGASSKPWPSREGTDIVFYFTGLVGGIKVYCFDEMQNIYTGAGLRARNETDLVTFNSLQYPLNVIGVSTPPVAVAVGGGRYYAYNGAGYFERPVIAPPDQGFYVECTLPVNLDAAITYAAYIPWSRSLLYGQATANGGRIYYNTSNEGCYGSAGAVNHTFAADGMGTSDFVVGAMFGVRSPPASDRQPTCSYIDTSQYPYPFNA